MSLLDLPVDILLLIFPYLDVPSFVSLTSTCKALHNTDISDYSSFWSSATRSTFRVPNQPVVQNDGKRWQKMYKRLLTQSRVFTWGNNGKGNLGHSFESNLQNRGVSPIMARRNMMRARGSRHVSWPTEMDHTQELGIIADLQAGYEMRATCMWKHWLTHHSGWSTTLLTSSGALYSVGVLDGMQFNQRHPPYRQTEKLRPERLVYPPGFPHPSERYDAVTAVQQFSSGRSHVLGLSDSGRIWSWNNIEQAALNVKFLNIELGETRGLTATSAVKKVVAGWSKSSALVAGTGIVLWEPLARSHHEAEIEDAALVLETAVVPGTSFQRSSVSNKASNARASEDVYIGEVLNYICLEHFVVFHTHLGRIFASRIAWDADEQQATPPFEIHIPHDRSSKTKESDDTAPHKQATDVQGSFRSFAIFTSDGRVYTGNQDHLQARFDRPLARDHLPFTQIPALQHTQVIALAFGDYHFHALHAPGYITSHGTESEGCGSLGLGGHADPEGRLRGLRYSGLNRDGNLVPHAHTTARRVWFEPEKREWIRFVTSGGNDPEEARERMRMCAEINVQGEVSEWVEQEGNAWAARFGPAKTSNQDDDDDGLGAYFALSVTAAGWHSGALVLVNDALDERVREGCIIRSQRPEKPARPTGNGPVAHDDTESPGYIQQAFSYADDWARWFLGLAPYAPRPSFDTTAAPTHGPAPAPPVGVSGQGAENGRVRPPTGPMQTPAPVRSRFVDPVNHGAAIDEWTVYKWKDDPFPRLRLKDGREMPGMVEFSEWRNGRPDWDLGFQA